MHCLIGSLGEMMERRTSSSRRHKITIHKPKIENGPIIVLCAH